MQFENISYPSKEMPWERMTTNMKTMWRNQVASLIIRHPWTSDASLMCEGCWMTSKVYKNFSLSHRLLTSQNHLSSTLLPKVQEDNGWLRPAFQKTRQFKSWRLRPAENITNPLSISSQNTRTLEKMINMVNSDWHDFSLEFIVRNDSNTYICTTSTIISIKTLSTVTSCQ